MITVIPGQIRSHNSIRFITVNNDTSNIVTCFASEDGLRNLAIVHLTPSEARQYAQQLIIMANKLDPIE